MSTGPVDGQTRATKITVIYDVPADPEDFEQRFTDQLLLAKRIPGLKRLESSKVWPKEDGTPAPAHRLVDLYFSDYDAASVAVTTSEAGAYFPSVFELGSSGVRVVFADVEEA